MKISDETLVEQALSGNTNSFSILVERYQGAVFALARSMTKNAEDARDLAQESFIKAYVNLSTLREPSKFAAWLKKITRTTCVQWLRDTANRCSLLTHIPAANPPKTPEDLVLEKELKETISAAIDALPEKLRLTTLLFYTDGLSYSEIADFQEVPVTTVKSRLYESRKRLKATLAKEVIPIMKGVLKSQAPKEDFTDRIMEILMKMESIGAIDCVTVGDLTGDGKQEIIVGTDIGVVMAFSPDGERLWRYNHPDAIKFLATADLNGDGRMEIIAATQGLLVMAYDGSIVWRYAGDEVRDMKIAETKDGNYEIVTITNKVRVFAPDSTLIKEYNPVEWTESLPEDLWPRLVSVGDIDGDGEYEIGAIAGIFLHVFKKDGTLLFSHSTEEFGYAPYRWYCMTMADLNDDGKAEILAGSKSWLHVFDEKGEELWRYEGPRHSARFIQVGDVNSDGKPEIALLGARPKEEIHLIDYQGNPLWQSPLENWLDSTMMADINNDGEPEIIVGMHARRPRILVINERGELESEYKVGDSVRSLAVSDIDADAKMEIIAGSDNLYVLDDKGKTKWLYRSGGIEFKVAAVDLDSDGVDEIIVGGSDVAAYKGDGTELWRCEVGHVYNLATGFLGDNLVIAAGCANNSFFIISSSGDVLWTHRFDGVARCRPCPMIADVKGDGINELIIQSPECHLFDAFGKELWRFHVIDGYGIDARCITTGNLDGLNGEEIIVAGIRIDESGLWALNEEGNVLWAYQYPVTKVEETEHGWKGGYQEMTSLATVDLNADGRDEIIGVSDKKLYCFSNKGQILWEVPLELPPYTRGVVKCFDLNETGVPKIICGTTGLSVYDANGNEQWNARCSGLVNDLAIADVNGDGYPEVIVASDELEVFSRDGVRLSNYMGIGKIDSVTTGDVDGDGILEIIAGGCGVYVLKMG